MDSSFDVKFSKNDENTILDNLKNFHEHSITIPKDGIPIQLKDGNIIRMNGIKKSGVEGGFIFSLCDREGQVLDEQTYMGKVLFSSKNISKGKYRKANAKNKATYLATGRTRDEINRDVIQEYISLKLANIVYDGISPEPKLGEVSDDGRLFLMTKMQGQKENENFSTLGELNDSSPGSLSDIPKEQWQAAYAVTVGLLNDGDANKRGNIGAIFTPSIDENRRYSVHKRLSLFDLGHPNPNKFGLDSNFLPTAWTKIGQALSKVAKAANIDRPLQQIFTIEPFIQDKLTADERKEALIKLCDKQERILSCLNTTKNELESKGYNTDVISSLQKEVEKRFEYLKKVTGYHTT
ncbi:MAG: hypothetical protein K2L13_00485 [Opitutales bacterium]|nr:hypothetical protein [Opitutales bacterium]